MDAPAAVTRATFLGDAFQNAFNVAIVSRLSELGAKDAYLVAGCLFQTVWNLRSGAPPEAQIADYDVFYFDDGDLSYEAEDAVIQRAAALFADLPVRVEVRNQARVHLWYPAKFGGTYPALTSTTDGIDRFLVECTCVGIQGAGEVYAPNGLGDLYEGVLRPNPRMRNEALFSAKAASYQTRWPFLCIPTAT